MRKLPASSRNIFSHSLFFVLKVAFILVFFFGAPVAFAFFARYKVSVASVNTTLDSLQSTSTPFSISLDPVYLSYFDFALGGATYRIQRFHECKSDEQYDENGNCIDKADLCPYIGLQSTNGEPTELGFTQDASRIDQRAMGEINDIDDLNDTWNISITSPCFEGECPFDYDSVKFGNPLPQSLKGQVFTCNVYVESQEPPILVKRLIDQNVAYAAGPQNIVKVSAILTGEYTAPVTGLSNVLFLPGLEASRLYKYRSVVCQLNCEDQLWESNKKTDVEDLYLNADGTSKNQDIYTQDAISETNTPTSLGLLGQNIYKSFFKTLDDLTDPALPTRMAQWQAYAYDWRQSVDDIVNNGTLYKRGHKSLIKTLENLVASSTTGKVTIIAHSNGGLLAKALMVKLQKMKDLGRSDLIDKVDVIVLVASPQIGTPSAVPVLLHGYDQRIMSGLLMDDEHARELGRNMPGGYGLLPSREYLNRVDSAPVAFTDNPIPSGIMTNLVNAYGTTTDSYVEYMNFLLGAEGRTDPAVSATKLPIKLSEDLLAQSESLHTSIDAWVPPASLRVVEVAGWGLDTIASFEYYPKLTLCTGGSVGCSNPYKLDQKPIFTVDGDKTVVEPSALYMQGERYWVNLPAHNGQLILLRRNREHKDILEVNELNYLLVSILKGKEFLPTNSVISKNKPIDTSNRLRLSIHSPVSIGSYDSFGNFTGKVCSDTEDFCYIQEDISNSSYLEFGEGKYINLPEENLRKVVLQGTGNGTFTFESKKVLPTGDVVISAFTDIPVTTQTEGEVVLNSVTQSPELKLDVTGDGTVDFTLLPTAEFDPITFLQIMKKTIESFDIKPARKTSLSKRIDGIIKSIQKGKIAKAQLKAEKFQNVLKVKVAKPLPKNPKLQKLSNADAEILIRMLETLLSNLEK